MAVDINKPQNQSNNSGFGLPKGEFKPIESTENRKWLRTTLIIAGAVLLLGAGIVFWLFKHHSGHKDFVTSTLQRHQEEDEEFKEDTLTEHEAKNSQNDEALTELKEFSEDFTTTAHKHAQPHNHLQANKQIQPSNETQKGQQESSSMLIVNTPIGLYHVIIASYIDIDLAMDYAKKLSKKGINSKIITPTKGKHFVRLSIAQATTWQEAKQQADDLKAEYGEQIWIMKY